MNYIYLSIQAFTFLYKDYICLHGLCMSIYVENIRHDYAKSGWPHVRKVREDRKMSGKKYVSHIHTNIIRIHV